MFRLPVSEKVSVIGSNSSAVVVLGLLHGVPRPAAPFRYSATSPYAANARAHIRNATETAKPDIVDLSLRGIVAPGFFRPRPRLGYYPSAKWRYDSSSPESSFLKEVKVSAEESKISDESRKTESRLPPASRTFPSGRRVAVC